MDQVRARSKIERTNLVGENRKVIVQMDSPIWISSLTVDTDSNTLYWVDMGRQTLEMVDYDGTLSSRKVLSRTLGATFLSMSMGKVDYNVTFANNILKQYNVYICVM